MIASFIAVVSFAQKTTDKKSSGSSKVTVYTCPMHPEYISFTPAKCPVCDENLSKKEIMKLEIARLYTCTKDKVICTKPGQCPECKKEMVAYKPKSKS